jgi:hypothetical protein
MKPPPFIGAPTLRELVWSFVVAFALFTFIMVWG